MSIPRPGNYFIINRVTSLAGRTLALNFEGKNAAVTVTELDLSATQVWIVRNFSGRTQSVCPQTEPSLQIGMGRGVLKTVPAYNYVWTIKETDGVYTIQDGALAVFWGLMRAIDGEHVSFSAGTGSDKQNWLLIPA